MYWLYYFKSIWYFDILAALKMDDFSKILSQATEENKVCNPIPDLILGCLFRNIIKVSSRKSLKMYILPIFFYRRVAHQLHFGSMVSISISNLKIVYSVFYLTEFIIHSLFIKEKLIESCMYIVKCI